MIRASPPQYIPPIMHKVLSTPCWECQPQILLLHDRRDRDALQLYMWETIGTHLAQYGHTCQASSSRSLCSRIAIFGSQAPRSTASAARTSVGVAHTTLPFTCWPQHNWAKRLSLAV